MKPVAKNPPACNSLKRCPVPSGRTSDLEAAFAMAWRYIEQRYPDLPPMQREFRFHERRKWRFDFAWPSVLVAVEIEGGTWINGRHSRGGGIKADCEKYNAAAIAGWIVLRYVSDDIQKKPLAVAAEVRGVLAKQLQSG